jgi:hypothetical protein
MLMMMMMMPYPVIHRVTLRDQWQSQQQLTVAAALSREQSARVHDVHNLPYQHYS